MIQTLSIRNFKSIKDIQLPCKKLNIFIGEPNSGKSNILEALALHSQDAISDFLNKQIFRYKSIGDLFYDFNINEPIEVYSDQFKTSLSYSTSNGTIENVFNFLPDKNQNINNPYKIDHSGRSGNYIGPLIKTNVRYYEYKRLEAFSGSFLPNLTVPYGDNLPRLLIANNNLKKWVSEFVQSKGLKLTLKPTENDITISKLVDDEIYSYPYFSISETLQRIIFYYVAIKSNKDAVLLLDEPESNTFPFYTKVLAEQIALDENNQFFVTTHNPYLLLSLIEKSKTENLNVGIVSMENFQTKIAILNENQLTRVLDFNSDVFFNFDRIFIK
jgi:AAA15 family ATPase/GTPase